MSLPPAVVFDWDNTLIDTFPLLKAASNTVRRAMGVEPWDDAEARLNIRLTAREVYPTLYGHRWQEAESIFYGHVRKHHLDAVNVIDGAAELLEWLQAQQVPMGILSNKRGEILRAEVRHLGWDKYFKTILGPDDVGGIGKPDPRGLAVAISRTCPSLGNGNAVWYVGDTENDLKTAKSAGVMSVYIENHTMSHPDMIALEKPNFTFKDCNECLDYLRTLV